MSTKNGSTPYGCPAGRNVEALSGRFRRCLYPPCANLLGSTLVVESGTFVEGSRRKQASEKCLLLDHLAESSQPRLYRFRK